MPAAVRLCPSMAVTAWPWRGDVCTVWPRDGLCLWEPLAQIQIMRAIAHEAGQGGRTGSWDYRASLLLSGHSQRRWICSRWALMLLFCTYKSTEDPFIRKPPTCLCTRPYLLAMCIATAYLSLQICTSDTSFFRGSVLRDTLHKVLSTWGTGLHWHPQVWFTGDMKKHVTCSRSHSVSQASCKSGLYLFSWGDRSCNLSMGP